MKTTRSPVRSFRSPTRRYCDFENSPRSTPRSRSLLRTSSSSESPARDRSLVDFKAALELEGENDDGSSRKVSSAHYQIFRQAVTSSKGSFKINLAKPRRAARASLLDLGDGKVTNRVSWLDQPSLTHMMASTARIAQGLKEDEPVEKTTLSESLNTESTSFKHLTVKQVFPHEPYRLRISAACRYYWYHIYRYLSTDTSIDTLASFRSIYYIVMIIFRFCTLQKDTAN